MIQQPVAQAQQGSIQRIALIQVKRACGHKPHKLLIALGVPAGHNQFSID